MIDTIRRSVRARRKTRPTPPAALFAGLVGLLVASCATSPTLAPSNHAQRVPGQPHAAVVSSHGIEVVAETEAWSGEPARFDDVVPVLVTITNDGDRPVRVRASDFWLVAESGQRLDGLAPFGVDEVVVQSNDLPIRPYGALSYGHAFHGFHPFAFGRLGHAGHFGHGLHDLHGLAHTPTFRNVRLPTSDMVAQALPERILEPGERVAGFVYFAGLEDDAVRVELAFDLVEPGTGTSLARMEIPFTTAEDGAELPERARDPGLDRPPEPAAIRVR